MDYGHRDEVRGRILHVLDSWNQAEPGRFPALQSVMDELGLDIDEATAAADYLSQKSLVEYHSVSGYQGNSHIRITAQGQDFVEHPDWYRQQPGIGPLAIYLISHYSQGVVMGDQYTVSGQVGAQGANAHAHDITFNQIWNQAQGDINLSELADQLSTLRTALKREAADSDDYDIEIGAIAAAQRSAAAGDGPKALEQLSQAGTWVLDVATKVGVPVAVEALKHALGM